MSRSGGWYPYPACGVSHHDTDGRTGGSVGRVLLSITLFCTVLMFSSCTEGGAVLSVHLTDAVSGGWVWGVRLEIQDRVTESYLQSDQGALPIELNGLESGPSTLTITAPGYRQKVIPINLRSGSPQHIEVALQGESIPGLSTFTIRRDDPTPYIQGALVPLDVAGSPVRYHPAVDLWIGFTISQELSGGVLAAAAVQQGASRGSVVDSGRLNWEWDSDIDAPYRYHLNPYTPPQGRLLPGSLHVVDILIVTVGPDGELPSRIEAAWVRDGAAGVIALLESVGTATATASSSASDSVPASTPHSPWYTILTFWNVDERGIIARQS